MPIAVCTCLCGSADTLARNFLHTAGYRDWVGVRIAKGREKSKSFILSLRDCPERRELEAFLGNATKWVIIIGWDETSFRWVDIAHKTSAAKIEAELLVQHFA